MTDLAKRKAASLARNDAYRGYADAFEAHGEALEAREAGKRDEAFAAAVRSTKAAALAVLAAADAYEADPGSETATVALRHACSATDEARMADDSARHTAVG